MLRIAVTKGRIEKNVYELMKKTGFDVSSIENKNRELLIRTKDNILLKVIDKKINQDDLKIGDVITFRSTSSISKDLIVTHRIIDTKIDI